MVSLTFFFLGGCGRLTCVYVCELFACNIHKGQKEGDGSLGIRVKGSCEPPSSECLEPRSPGRAASPLKRGACSSDQFAFSYRECDCQ